MTGTVVVSDDDDEDEGISEAEHAAAVSEGEAGVHAENAEEAAAEAEAAAAEAEGIAGSVMMAANDAAISVFKNAAAVMESTRSSEPALKPYQPNHSRPVPSAMSGTLCGLFSTT